VDDLATSIEFYTRAFGLRYDVVRRTDDDDYSSLVIGEYGRPGFFLLTLMGGRTVRRHRGRGTARAAGNAPRVGGAGPERQLDLAVSGLIRPRGPLVLPGHQGAQRP
jgi:catechol 2,3-dioxygenase-like lactoylglutathione lyase family enzyme